MKMLAMEVGPLSTVCYILSDGGSACVVDPGGEGERVINELERLGAAPEVILLTHGHFDHVSAVGELKEKYPDACVYIHRDDAVLMKSPDTSYAEAYGVKVHPKTKADVLLSDGDEVEWRGRTFTVLHTPGHTPGSVCYVSGDVMFSGDTLFFESVGTTSLYGGDSRALKKSLERLKALPGDHKIFPGHGGQTTLEHERQSNFFMNHDFL